MLKNYMMTVVGVLMAQRATVMAVSPRQKWTLCHVLATAQKMILHAGHRNGTVRSAMLWRHQCLLADQPPASDWQLQTTTCSCTAHRNARTNPLYVTQDMIMIVVKSTSVTNTILDAPEINTCQKYYISNKLNITNVHSYLMPTVK